MDETVEIPALADDPYLLDLSVCGMLRTRNQRILNQLKRLDKGRMVARGKRENLIVQLFSGGNVKNHLHVNLLLRPPKWKPDREWTSIEDLQAAIAAFSGIDVNASIRGQFIVPISELPKSGIIRLGMTEAKHGLAMKQTSQTMSFDDPVISQLSWTLLKKNTTYVNIGLAVRKTSTIGPEYLSDCEAFAYRAFNALILMEPANADSNR
ncbi:MAG TPA: hypothetical protein VG269_21400 [Tepidisphaeraceae bacterium]|jgi:hypothetical protein|nr:hypothetical protein [Tepidisphaeraceae bacterium]